MKEQQIINNFVPNEEIIAKKPIGNGLINVTKLIKTKSGKKFVLQKINSTVFKDVDALMNNIVYVTNHLHNKNIETIMMLQALDGKRYVSFGENYYRIYEFLNNTETYEAISGFEMIEKAASAFGRFHNDLADLDASKLVEIIPNFHDTKKRYQNFLKAVENDFSGRSKDCINEINEIKKYAEYYGLIVDGIASGEVKLHVTHNDPKINNALFDSKTSEFRCIIDLDTTMPGSVLYDFGDAIRSLITGDREDSLEYGSVVVNFNIYRHYLKAYYKETKNFLTPKELELLPYSPFILAMELSMRFLEDFLNGDTYFKTTRPNHNLDRCRTQLNLGKSILKNIAEMKRITKMIIGE